MSISIDQLGQSILELNVTGKLERADYDKLVPMADELIRRNGYLSLIIHVSDFSGWTVSGLLQDLRFDARHYADVKRMALVASSDSKKWLATLSKPFTKAEVAFFTEDRIVEARGWVMAA